MKIFYNKETKQFISEIQIHAGGKVELIKDTIKDFLNHTTKDDSSLIKHLNLSSLFEEQLEIGYINYFPTEVSKMIQEQGFEEVYAWDLAKEITAELEKEQLINMTPEEQQALESYISGDSHEENEI